MAHVPNATGGRRARDPAAAPIPETRLPGGRKPRAAIAPLPQLARVRGKDGRMSLAGPLTLRLTRDLEAILSLPDPRTKLSAYHDMPYALFRYDPTEEFELRKQVTLLETRLSQRGKRIRRISLAECL